MKTTEQSPSLDSKPPFLGLRQAVDPENRLVASTLEKRWEEALSQ